MARLFTAPHRLAFFAATAMLAASASWWLVALAARGAGVALPWAVPPPVAHGLVMSLGFMPLFIAGFLFTAGPRWLALPVPTSQPLRGPVAAMLGGWLAALAGFHFDAAWAGAGLAAVAAGWGLVAWRFRSLLRRSRADDRLHARVIAAAATLLAVAMAAAALALARGDLGAARAATQLALWAGLAPIFAAASHRMLPFLDIDTLPLPAAWRPRGLLWTLLALLLFCAAGALAEVLRGPPTLPVQLVQAAVEAAAALMLLGLALHFAREHGLRTRMVVMLYGGYVWFGLALALAAASHALQAAGRAGLGLAPVHALGMGFLGTTMIAMVTRVTAAHSGRSSAADDAAWVLYWGFQAAAVLRVAAAVWATAPAALTLGAGAVWAAASVAWACRYGLWLGSPRADGRPG